MSNAVFPFAVRGLTFTVLKAFEFDTLVQSAPNKVETRIAQTQNPIWHWAFIYDYLKDYAWQIVPTLSDTDLRTLMGFCLARQGQFDDFLYDDPDDDSVGPGLLPSGAPNLQAQLQLITDPQTLIMYSPVQRLMGGQFYEDITDLGPAGIKVYANGLLKAGGGVDYTLAGPGLAITGQSFMGLYLQWVTTPTPPITAQFNFYFRTRFEMDQQDFEKFLAFLWTIGGSGAKSGSGTLKIRSSRSANV